MHTETLEIAFGKRVRVSVEPNRDVDLAMLIFRLAGYSSRQTVIGQERIIRHAPRVVGEYKKLGADNHPAVTYAKDFLASRKNLLDLLAHYEQDPVWEQLKQDFDQEFGSAIPLYGPNGCDNYEAEIQKFVRMLDDCIHHYGVAEEVVNYFGEMEETIYIRLIPSYYYEPVGGTCWHGASVIQAALFFWTPFEGDQMLSPMEKEWLYQGLLHFLTLCQTVLYKEQLRVDELVEVLKAQVPQVSASWIWRNVFLAARARVFAKYCNEDYAKALVRYYVSQGNHLTPAFYDLLPGTNETSSYIEQLRSAFGLLQEQGISYVLSELERPFAGPLGACFTNFLQNPPLVGVYAKSREPGIEAFAKAVWRQSRVAVQSYLTTPDGWERRNLMLYCTDEEDPLLKSFLTPKGVHIEGNKITIRGMEFTAEHLRYRFVLRHTQDQQRWVCIFGASTLQIFRDYRKTVYLDLFFDFIVLDGDRIIAAGYFSEPHEEVVFVPQEVLMKLGIA